jgi:homoserine kinase type II
MTTELHSTFLQAILADGYITGRFFSAEPISSGFANKNYKLITERGPFLCRLVLQKSIDKLEEEIELLLFLKSRNFPAAYPVSRMDGSYITLLDDGTPLVLYNFLAGEEPLPNPVTAAGIGNAAGQLNSIPSEKWSDRKNDLSLEKCREVINQSAAADSRLSPMLDEFAIETEALSDALATDLPAGLVHGDLYPDNTIFLGNELLGILDFEEFCVDTLLFDVGNAVQGFCYPGKELDLSCFTALLKAYHSQRPFAKTESEMVPWYIRWGALSQISWHLRYGLLSRFNERQFNRVTELMQRIVQLRNEMGILEREVNNLVKA